MVSLMNACFETALQKGVIIIVVSLFNGEQHFFKDSCKKCFYFQTVGMFTQQVVNEK